ncbi:MAG: hypothetical protein HQ542_11530 [Bacteroidia bacterium]|nr:hypothetical protein [Bacteroidia bacterium]
MSRFGFLTAFLIWFPCMISGQNRESFTVTDKPLRIEIAAQSEKETYRIIPCGSAGMVLFYKSVEVTTDNSTRWYFTFYDRNLQRIWIKSAPILSSQDFKDVAIGEDTLYLYFESDKKNRNREVNFQILRIILQTGSFVLNNGKTPESGAMLSFEVFRQKAFIGLNSEENISSVLIMDLPTGQPLVIPLMPGDPSTLLHCSVDSHTMNMTLLISRQLSKRTTELYFCRYKPDGTKLLETRVSNNNFGYEFTRVTEMGLSDTETLIAGTYTASSARKKSKEVESSGFFTAPVVSAIQESTDFYNFLDMKNIRQLLSERDMLNLRKKSMKKSRSDQEYSLDFSLLLHNILPGNNQFIVAAEAYNLQYHTESFTDYDFYGRPFTNSYSVFEGYRFTGIILAAFDKEGKMIWDNAMSIKNLLSFTLEPKVTLYPSGNEIILTYLSEGKIACRIIQDAGTIEKTSFSELELMTANDKLLAESRSSMVHWFDEYFLCFGYQEIRDISKGGNDKRLVFFCNKVRFDR